jgi:hypothetical protein
MEEMNKKREHKTNSDLRQEHKYDHEIYDSTSGGKYLDYSTCQDKFLYTFLL